MCAKRTYDIRFLNIPDNNPSINTARADLGDLAASFLVAAQHLDSVLVGCLQLRVVLDLALQIHLPEHVPGAFLLLTTRLGSGLRLQRANQLPTTLVTLEAVRLAVVACGDDSILAGEEQRLEWQQLRADVQHGLGWGIRGRRVHNRDAAVVRRKGQSVAARAEGHTVHPTSRVVQKLSADGVERQPLAPGRRLRALVDALDEGGEDAGVAVGRAGAEQDAVGVPGDRGDGAADGLLQVLRHPPVVLLLEVANGDDARAAADGELGLRGRPAHAGRGAVDAEQDERRLPAGGCGLPDVGVAVWWWVSWPFRLQGCAGLVGCCSPIDGGAYPESR